jgi:hypothetical protein
MMKRSIATLGLGLGLLVGCASYYRVHDPTTGKTYYTTELKRQDNGATTLKDAKTGSVVTIQNSEVSQISKEDFDAGQSAQPLPVKPSAAPAPTPTGTGAPSAF